MHGYISTETARMIYNLLDIDFTFLVIHTWAAERGYLEKLNVYWLHFSSHSAEKLERKKLIIVFTSLGATCMQSKGPLWWLAKELEFSYPQ